MENMRVLILEDDVQTAETLKKSLASKANVRQVECASTEAEALEFMQQSAFDFMVLDLIMSQTDGFHCLECINKMDLEHTPDVIVTSALSNENAIKKSIELGAKYYMVKPCDPDIMYDRMIDIKTIEDSGQDEFRANEKALEYKIMEVLLTLGMPPHLKGYQYLKEAIKMVLKDPSCIHSITKKLYPGIAKKYGVTATKVELAIRHTIEVAWQRNKLEKSVQVFGYDLFTKNSRPTNGELIALVSDKIRIESTLG